MQIAPLPYAHFMKGIAYRSLNQVEAAKKEFEIAIQLDSTNADAHSRLGAIYVQLGRMAEARKQFETAYRLDNTYLEPLYNLAVLHSKMNEDKAALNYYRQFRKAGGQPDPKFERLLAKENRDAEQIEAAPKPKKKHRHPGDFHSLVVPARPFPAMTGSTLEHPVALTIAGFDTCAGAGLQADLLTFHNHGYHCLTACTSLVLETPHLVRQVEPVSADLLLQQVDLLLSTYPVAAIKVGSPRFPRASLGLTRSFSRTKGPPCHRPRGESPPPDLAYKKTGTPQALLEQLAPLGHPYHSQSPRSTPFASGV